METDPKMPEVTLNKENCVSCKTCISICPMGVYGEKDDHVTVVNPGECIACMGCVAACPAEAITVTE